METLHNLHPIDTKVGELGTTVRRGDKWAKRVGVGATPQAQIELCVCVPPDIICAPEERHHVVGHGEVQEVHWHPFYLISLLEIEHEHQESSRTYDGLLESMRHAYGPDFSEDDIVTILTYRRTD